MVRVGANVSSYVKGMREASVVNTAFGKSGRNVQTAVKGYESPFKAAARASAAFKQEMVAVTKANDAAKDRLSAVSQELKKAQSAMQAVRAASDGLKLGKTFSEERADIETEIEAVNGKLRYLRVGMKGATDGVVDAGGGRMLHMDDAQAEFAALEAKSDALAQKLAALDEVAGHLGDSFQSSTIKAAMKEVQDQVDRLGAEYRATESDVARLAERSSQMSRGSPAAAAGSAALKAVGNNISSLFKGVSGSAKDGTGSVTRLLSGIKRIGVVSLGLRVASGLFNKLKSAVSSCLTSSAAYNEVTANMNYQLTQALAPAIGLVTSLLQKALPVISSVASAFSTILVAAFGEASEAAYAASAAMAGAGTYGFDQITKIDNSAATDTMANSTGMFSGVADKVAAEIHKVKTMLTSGDWAGIGATFAGYLNSAFDAIGNLNLADKVNKGLTGVLNALNGFVVNTDWGGLMGSLASSISSFITGIDWNSIGTLLSNSVLGLLDMVISLVTETDWGGIIFSVIDGIGTLIETIDWGGIISKLTAAIFHIVARLPEILANAMAGIYSAVGSIFNALGLTFLGDLYKKVGEGWRKLGAVLADGAQKYLEKVESYINGVIWAINKLIEGWNAISSFTKGLGINLSIEPIDPVNLHLATGGIAVKPVTAEIGEAGREAVLPLERNTGWAKTVAALIDGERDSGGQPMIIQVYIGGKKIHEETIDYINRKTQQNGVCPIRI